MLPGKVPMVFAILAGALTPTWPALLPMDPSWIMFEPCSFPDGGNSGWTIKGDAKYNSSNSVTLTDTTSTETSDGSFLCNTVINTLQLVYIRLKLQFGPYFGNRAGKGLMIFFATPESLGNGTSTWGLRRYGFHFKGMATMFSPYENSIYSYVGESSSTFSLNPGIGEQCVNPATFNISHILRSAFTVEIDTDESTVTMRISYDNDANTVTCDLVNYPMASLDGLFPLHFGIGGRQLSSERGHDIFVKSIDFYNKTSSSLSTATLSSGLTGSTGEANTSTEKGPGKSFAASLFGEAVAKMVTESIMNIFAEIPEETATGGVPVDTIQADCDDFNLRFAAPPNNGKANEIRAAFSFRRIDILDDVGEWFRIYGVLFMTWNITTCPLRNSMADLLGRVTSKRVDIPEINSVWTPKILFISSTNDVFMKGKTFGDDFLAVQSIQNSTPNQTLEFFWSRSGLFTSVCHLDLRKFPFDHQVCNFTFALQRSIELVTFVEPILVFCEPITTGIWYLYSCSHSVEKTVLETTGNKVSVVTFSAYLHREPQYYVINYVLPSFALAFLCLFSFLMPSGSEERPAFTVTILLALCVSQSDANVIVPRTSYIILLPTYLLFLTGFSVIVTLYHMFVCWMIKLKGHKKLQKKRKIIFFKMSFVGIMDLFAFVLAILVFVAIHAHAALTAFASWV